jgi:hypothetical protein
VLIAMGQGGDGFDALHRALAIDPADAGALGAMGRALFIGRAQFDEAASGTSARSRRIQMAAGTRCSLRTARRCSEILFAAKPPRAGRSSCSTRPRQGSRAC